MNLLSRLSIFIFLFVLFFTNISYSQCGKERWNVKTLTDKDTIKIDFENIIQSTVSEQCALTRPSKVKNKPRMKSETTVYEIEAYVIEYKLEDDRDFHVVIEDPKTEEKMVVEIVDPGCPDIDNTSRYEAFTKVRDWFTKNFHPTKSFKTTKKKVKLTGVGFFDFIHGQRGMAPNGREIHPVLSIKYMN
jgi:hypothetical protein